MQSPDEELTPTKLAALADISVPFASQVLSGAKVPSTRSAIRIYRATGQKFGPIAGATDEEIDVLERYQGAA